MSEFQSDWSHIWKISQRFLRATICAFIAWLCAHGPHAGINWLIYFGILFAAGAIVHGAVALFQTIKAIVAMMRWLRFKRKGADPKADQLAGRDALRKRGLL
ncbi:MAG: hypothetical protein AAF636_20620 [Pseudomonadota bacterium]